MQKVSRLSCVLGVLVTLPLLMPRAEASDCLCDDGIPCTVDSCAPDGSCLHVPVDAACDDGDACTFNACDPDAGGCVQSLAPGCCFEDANCDDGRVCTVDTCGPDGRCAYVLREGCCETDPDCDDKDACTLDRCAFATGACVHVPVAGCCRADGDCPPNQPCETGRCDLGTATCRFETAPDGARCEDGDPCTTDATCQDGACRPQGTLSCEPEALCVRGACARGIGCIYDNAPDCCVLDSDCDDEDPCTLDACDTGTGRCVNLTIASCCLSDADCDDGRACTTGRCRADQTCELVPVGDDCCERDLDCDDANPCTTNRCDLARGRCEAPAPVLDGIVCDDGDACTVDDLCVGGLCTGAARDCDDGSACTANSCDPVLGCLVEAVPACCRADTDCPSGDQCNFGFCDLGSGQCATRPIADRSVCDDPDACTTRSVCLGGACVGTPVICDDGDACTTDLCDPVAGCVHTPIDNCCVSDGDCDDGDACNGQERCVTGLCVEGPPPVCDDWDACTVNACLPDRGCVSAPVSRDEDPACAWRRCGGDCDDGDPCTDDVCEPVTGLCQHLPIHAPPACLLPGAGRPESGCQTGAPGPPALLLTLLLILWRAWRRRSA